MLFPGLSRRAARGMIYLLLTINGEYLDRELGYGKASAYCKRRRWVNAPMIILDRILALFPSSSEKFISKG
jgi:hypothetical protein